MEFNKKNKAYKSIMLVILTALITFLLTTIGVYNYFTKTEDGNIEILTKHIETSESTNALDAKIELVKKYLEGHYIGDLDEEKMTEHAVKGYVEGLGEKYTEYLTKDEYEDLLITVRGNYVGIGIYMSQTVNGEIVILMPMEGSPAEEAGLKTGDIITKINGEECTGLDLNLATAKIKGEEGTTVNLEILREKETFTLDVKRKRIEIKYIDSKVIEPGIGYIKLTSFDDGSAESFKEHLENLKKKNITSLIIDLRDNGGGIVEETIDIAECFVPREQVIMKSYNKDQKETVVKSSNSKPTKLNIAVLVNENSASATEIFAAAIKDNKVGRIVGKTTFGKGVMQEVIELSTGGALKVTIEEFKTPNGDTINKTGIKPDIEVDSGEKKDEDLQLQKAIEILK